MDANGGADLEQRKVGRPAKLLREPGDGHVAETHALRPVISVAGQDAAVGRGEMIVFQVGDEEPDHSFYGAAPAPFDAGGVDLAVLQGDEGPDLQQFAGQPRPPCWI